jgi:hypothetical protein
MGDLNGDGEVAEVVYLVGCALGDHPVGCLSRRVAIDDLILAVNHAMHGCDEVGEVWMSIVPCRQCYSCEPEIDFRIWEILPIALLGLPQGLVPDGIQVLNARVEVPEIVCLACGCPAGPIFYALVAKEDVPRMIEAGWQRERHGVR